MLQCTFGGDNALILERGQANVADCASSASSASKDPFYLYTLIETFDDEEDKREPGDRRRLGLERCSFDAGGVAGFVPVLAEVAAVDNAVPAVLESVILADPTIAVGRQVCPCSPWPLFVYLCSTSNKPCSCVYAFRFRADQACRCVQVHTVQTRRAGACSLVQVAQLASSFASNDQSVRRR